MTVRIEEFAKLEGTWRIDWLGRILSKGFEGTLTQVAVHLAQLDSQYQDPLSNTALATPHRVEQIPLDIGLIALLKIGSVWRDGIHVQPPKQPTHVEVELSASAFRLIRLDDVIELEGQNVPLLPPIRHKVGGRHYADIASSWLAVAKGVQPDGSTRVLAIPSAIIFQATMATSSLATRSLVQGKIDKIVDPNWGWLVNDPKTVRIELFKNFRDAEGPVMANLKADLEAAKAYRTMRHHLVATSVDHKGPGEPKLHLKLPLPFTNPVKLRLAGKPIAFELRSGATSKKVWGFLATEVVKLEPTLVFSRLIIDRKNDNRKGANSGADDLLEGWAAPVLQPTALSEPFQPLTSEDEPGSHLEQLALQAAVGFNAIGLEIIDNPKEVQQYRNANVVRPEGEPHEGQGSTADPVGGLGIAPANIEGEPEIEVPITLEHFFGALDILTKHGLHFETLAVAPPALRQQRGIRIVNFFRGGNKGLRNWRRILVGNKGRPRGFVVAEAFHGGVWHYLIEVEHKRAGELSMLHMHLDDGTRVEVVRFAYFMEAVAQHNGWQATDGASPEWRFGHIRHSGQRGSAALAAAIRRHVG